MALGYDITATRFNQRDFQIQRKNHFEIEFDNTFIDSNLKFFVSSITLPKETTESFVGSQCCSAILPDRNRKTFDTTTKICG